MSDRAASVGSRGSSPRVRGTETLPAFTVKNLRFIPACAGNRSALRGVSLLRKVHPRVCGEQTILTTSLFSPLGSSPRVRGTAVAYCAKNLRTRFIPACAGNRKDALDPDREAAVHPRVCGEQVRLTPHNLTKRGSSPRVRGTVAHWYAACLLCRFIPACAGNRR